VLPSEQLTIFGSSSSLRPPGERLPTGQGATALSILTSSDRQVPKQFFGIQEGAGFRPITDSFNINWVAPTVTLDIPGSTDNIVEGTTSTTTATVLGVDDAPLSSVPILFIITGPAGTTAVLGGVGTDDNGVTSATFKWPRPGSYAVTARATGVILTPVLPLAVTVSPNFVAIKLTPLSGNYHPHEPITLTALVMDANNAPVPGITANFGIWGNCRIEPPHTLRTAVTDARGIATITVHALHKGRIAVIAAARNSAASVVNSEPARLKVGVHGGQGEPYHVDDRCASCDCNKE
jgi:hypothetical protein